jgi:hypothetical protein
MILWIPSSGFLFQSFQLAAATASYAPGRREPRHRRRPGGGEKGEEEVSEDEV